MNQSRKLINSNIKLYKTSISTPYILLEIYADV